MELCTKQDPLICTIISKLGQRNSGCATIENQNTSRVSDSEWKFALFHGRKLESRRGISRKSPTVSRMRAPVCVSRAIQGERFDRGGKVGEVRGEINVLERRFCLTRTSNFEMSHFPRAPAKPFSEIASRCFAPDKRRTKKHSRTTKHRSVSFSFDSRGEGIF